MNKWDSHLSQHWYPHAGRHFWCSYLMGIGLEKELVQELQKWSSDALVDIYNDNTAKDRKWKGLAKLKEQLDSDIKPIEVTEETEK
jgi:integrase